MSKLLTLRQKLNLTQEELFERSGISVRTIQRIEAGTIPKGYTLKALAKGLGAAESELLELGEPIPAEDLKWLKIVNLSSLLFMFLPPLNIAVPLLIIFLKSRLTPLVRIIVSIQIVWTLLAIVLFLIILASVDWFGVKSKFMMLVPIAWLLANAFVILRNAAEIDRNKNLYIFKNFSII